tara:strand:- start:363 stop:581 length:219 start_codon:yes stop_codon:yes gene_type:complete
MTLSNWGESADSNEKPLVSAKSNRHDVDACHNCKHVSCIDPMEYRVEVLYYCDRHDSDEVFPYEKCDDWVKA